MILIDLVIAGIDVHDEVLSHVITLNFGADSLLVKRLAATDNFLSRWSSLIHTQYYFGLRE